MTGWFPRVSFVAFAGLIAMQLIPSNALAQYSDDQDYGPPPLDRRQDQNWDRRPREHEGCNRRDLVDAARDEGFRRIDSVQMNGRRIVVRGWNDGGPDRMSFANRRGCPVID